MVTTSKGQTPSSGKTSGPVAEGVLRAIRRILQRTADHSRQLARDGGLSVPQLLCLRKVAESTKSKPVTVTDVASAVHLSNATVSRILDRLESSHLILRERGTIDRRKVFLWITSLGKRRIKSLPTPLQVQFLDRLLGLSEDDPQTSALA